MMYLVRPVELLWTDIGHISPEEIVEMGGNLEAIDDWQLSDRSLERSDIAVALRYGIPVKAGIVVAAIHVVVQQRPRELREVHEKAKRSGQHPQIKATEEFIDKYLIPGWKKHGEELDQRIDEQSEKLVEEALEEARNELAVPVKPELVEHWRGIGGIVPK